MVVATKLSTVKSRQVAWLWPGRIALGKLSLLCGDPNVGKSFLTCFLAAAVSRGGEVPGGNALLGSVALLSAEDGVEDTVKPRLETAGADLTKIAILSGVHDLRRDLGRVESVCRDLGDCKLLVIDPISAYMPGIDGHKNSEVRGVLAPLAAMAESLNVAVLLVQHLNKSESARGMGRVCGSVAFAAAARNVWLVETHGPDRVLTSLKSNLAIPGEEISYRIQRGRVVWGEPKSDASVQLAKEGYTDEEIAIVMGFNP